MTERAAKERAAGANRRAHATQLVFILSDDDDDGIIESMHPMYIHTYTHT